MYRCMYNTRVVRILVKIKIGERLQENDRNKKMHAVIQENVVNFGNDNIRSEARFKVIVVELVVSFHGSWYLHIFCFNLCMHAHSCIHACKGNCIIYTYICIYTPKTSFVHQHILELRKIPKLVPLFISLSLPS